MLYFSLTAREPELVTWLHLTMEPGFPMLTSYQVPRRKIEIFLQNSTMNTTIQHAVQILISSPGSEKKDPLPRESDPGLASAQAQQLRVWLISRTAGGLCTAVSILHIELLLI